MSYSGSDVLIDDSKQLNSKRRLSFVPGVPVKDIAKASTQVSLPAAVVLRGTAVIFYRQTSVAVNDCVVVVKRSSTENDDMV